MELQNFVLAMSQPPPRPPWNYSEMFMCCSEYLLEWSILCSGSQGSAQRDGEAGSSQDLPAGVGRGENLLVYILSGYLSVLNAVYLQELSDFAVEIDILHEFSHKNIIKLYDAFFHDTKLWVSL